MAYESAEKIISDGLESLRRYYSTYRGIVVDPNDPLHQNRLLVCVPEVMGGTTSWAYPKGQHGSAGDGFKYFTPKMGDIVFVTFEFGDHTKPLWEFHGWGINQIPDMLDGVNKCGIVTPEGNLIVLDDEDGSLTVKFSGPITIQSDKEVSVMAASSIMVKSDQSICFNDGDNQGMINIKDLTDKLNYLVQQLETLRQIFNTHVHSGVTTGPGSSAIPVTQASAPFRQFNQIEYEDLSIIH